MDRLNNLPNNYKYIENKKTTKVKISKKSFAWIMTCLKKLLPNSYLFVHLFLYTIAIIQPERSKLVHKVHSFIFVK